MKTLTIFAGQDGALLGDATVMRGVDSEPFKMMVCPDTKVGVGVDIRDKGNFHLANREFRSYELREPLTRKRKSITVPEGNAVLLYSRARMFREECLRGRDDGK